MVGRFDASGNLYGGGRLTYVVELGGGHEHLARLRGQRGVGGQGSEGFAYHKGMGVHIALAVPLRRLRRAPHVGGEGCENAVSG